jgi:hypothetical protein
MTEKPGETPNEDTRLSRLESELRGLRKFVTTLETGHESRAKDWNRKLAAIAADVDGLKDRVRKTRKKVRKLSR